LGFAQPDSGSHVFAYFQYFYRGFDFVPQIQSPTFFTNKFVANKNVGSIENVKAKRDPV
jgi:hypothetical protein